MARVTTRPRHNLIKAKAQPGTTAVHVDHLNVADGESITRRLIENIQFNFANAKIQLLIQRQVFVVDRPRRLRIRRFQCLPMGRRHGFFVTVMAADKLDFVKPWPLSTTRQNENQHKPGKTRMQHHETFMKESV